MEIELNKPYTHTKTGRPYTLITNNFMFKEPHRDSNGEMKYEWRRGLCLYKTEYENPDGEYFARTRICMHMCCASTTTITPLGCKAS